MRMNNTDMSSLLRLLSDDSALRAMAQLTWKAASTAGCHAACIGCHPPSSSTSHTGGRKEEAVNEEALGAE
jgi:hypothetical protein